MKGEGVRYKVFTTKVSWQEWGAGGGAGCTYTTWHYKVSRQDCVIMALSRRKWEWNKPNKAKRCNATGCPDEIVNRDLLPEKGKGY